MFDQKYDFFTPSLVGYRHDVAEGGIGGGGVGFGFAGSDGMVSGGKAGLSGGSDGFSGGIGVGCG